MAMDTAGNNQNHHTTCACGNCRPTHTMNNGMNMSGSMLNTMSPKLAFCAGALLTAGIMFAIGFIVLLVMMMKGVNLGSTTTTAAKVSNTNVAAANTNQAAAAKPAGKVDMSTLRNTLGTGDITIVEYSDPECPFCKRFQSTMQQVMEKYDGQVRWSYKQLPLPSLHSKAPKEANATECAADQGKFWEYIDEVYTQTNSNDSLPDAAIYSIADKVGLDRAKFDACVTNNDHKDRIATDSAEGEALGGQGTPFSVIVDKDGNVLDTIPGALPYDSVVSTLDSILKK